MCVFTYFIFIQIRCKIKLTQVNLSQSFRINETPFDVKAKLFEYSFEYIEMMQINGEIFGNDMRTHHPLNELYIHFPVDHGGSSLENFSNAGIVVPVSTFGNDLK
jgi:hypothetical protein